MAEPVKVVLSGGPPGKKAEAIHQLRAEANAKGYALLLLPGAEALLEKGGVLLTAGTSQRDLASIALRLQLELERSFLQAAQLMAADKVLLLYEHGALDIGARVPDREFTQVLREMDLSLLELRDRYDGVFLLDPSDTRRAAAWTGHPHVRMLDGGAGIDPQRLSAELTILLGDPRPVEIERKFLVEPDPSWLEDLSPSRSVSITQVYLNAPPGEEIRIRRRSADGASLYYQTTKRSLTGMKRIEVERRISEAEYHALLADADPSRHPIQKTRTYFLYQNQYFELDTYPFWTDRAILEIELSSETESVRVPERCRVIREVTGDPNYKNAALSKLELQE